MPRPSRRSLATKKNAILGGGRPSFASQKNNYCSGCDNPCDDFCNNFGETCYPCDRSSNSVFHKFSNRSNDFNGYNILQYEDEDDEVVIISENTLEYELNISESYKKLLNVVLAYKIDDGIKKKWIWYSKRLW